VELSRTTVENEERKFQLGMSTLFDVIQAEDQLTSALLSRISTQQRFAAARARLAFETGALVRDQDGRAVPDAAALAILPSPRAGEARR
jgi:outer membrane protein TolC